ncbi:MAG: hypothetical protein A2Z29_01025 [Chloroflexi bacterium RBG_16_56_11]|nr:MAG: hypothetical protein A2Z29_01025 [Chloroflexi bacterium RBG_16_56_11]
MAVTAATIKDITSDPLGDSVEIIRRGFGTVTAEMGLTEETAPYSPAFMTLKQLEELRDSGAVFFGFFVGNRQIGFVAVQEETDGVYFMKRLAVLPEFRHHGYGRELVKKVIDYLRTRGINKLSLAMVNEQTVLKDWYQGMGFKEKSIEHFGNMPFTICFMEKNI